VRHATPLNVARVERDIRIVRPTCTLRLLESSDAESISRHANDREIWLNLRDLFPYPYTVTNAEWYIGHVAGESPPLGFGIDVNGAIVGSISLKPGTDIERVNAEIGYWLGQEFWGRGIVTDAVIGMTQYAFGELQFNRVFAVPFARNPASCRVLEKAGYVREGVMRRSAIKDGVLQDQCLYAAYDDRWSAPS
jgi:RimJ/RimL family protein N-acetyltransferase